jgi:hypothetical protein
MRSLRSVPLCEGGTILAPVPDPCVNQTPTGAYLVSGKPGRGSLRCGPYDCAGLAKVWREEDRLMGRQ